MQRYVWPAVVAFGMALAAVVLILVFVPAENAAAQNAVVAILAILGSTVSSIIVLARVKALHGELAETRDGIADVQEKVNGRMTQLIAAKTLPDPEAPAAPESR